MSEPRYRIRYIGGDVIGPLKWTQVLADVRLSQRILRDVPNAPLVIVRVEQIERAAEVIHWTAPWDIEGYQPPNTYEGAKELAKQVLAAAQASEPALSE
jgi:hypothetical protein